MKNFIILVCIICHLSAYIGSAKEAITLKLTKEAAVKYAIENNKELKAVSFNIAAAYSVKKQSGRLANPSLSADYGNDWAFNNEGEYDLSVSIKQKFPLTGRLSKEKKIADIDILLAKCEFEQYVLTLSKDVELAYIKAMGKLAFIKYLEGILDSTKDMESQLNILVNRGEISSLDLAQIKTQKSTLLIDIANAKNEYNESMYKLKNLLFCASDIELTETLSEDKSFLPAKFSDTILQNRPDYQMYKIAQDSATAEIALIKANKYEDIEVGVFIANQHRMDNPTGIEKETLLGVSLSIALPLNSFDGSISKQTALRSRAENYAQAKEFQIRNEVDFYSKQIEYITIMLNNFDKEINELSKDTTNNFRQAYQKGQIGMLEYLTMRQNISSLEAKRIDILIKKNESIAILKYAMGIKLEKETTNEK